MIRIITKLCVVGVTIIVTSATALSAELAVPTFSELNRTRRPSPFSHQFHLRVFGGEASSACTTCHHPVQGAAEPMGCAEPGCHDDMSSRATGVDAYYIAIHKKEKTTHWSCVSCHEQEAGDDAEKLKKLSGCKNSVCHS